MLIYEINGLFRIVFSVFVIWSLVRWLRLPTLPTLRGRLGSIGLAVGSVSAALFAWLYIRLWVSGTLLAHGSALYIYAFVGLGLAVIGLFLGLGGTGWVRQSALLICIVMVCQWLRDLAVGAKARNLTDGAMYIALLLFGIILLWNRYFARGEQRPD
jgi:hypothetical protein